MSAHTEVEIKLRLESAAAGRYKLRRAGFRKVQARALETNIVFDTERGALRGRGLLIRLRDIRGETILTYKGPPAPGRHKSRREVEVSVSNGQQFTEILAAIGLAAVFRYQKFRTEYAKGRRGVVTLDETPVGVFFELEGEPAWIDATARKLGFSETDYITGSYGGLYLEACRRRGVKARDMVF